MKCRIEARRALALLLCAGASVGCAGARLESVGPQEAADRARPGVERVRGLRFLREVGAREQTREERKDELTAELQGADEKAVQARESRALEILAYQLFGMLPVHFDAESEIPEVDTDNLAGYYDPEERSLTLIRGAGSADATSGVVGHELVHALQDQHFEIGAARRVPRDNDASMALRALIEGDATLAGLDFGSFRELQAASMADEDRRELILTALSLSRFAQTVEGKSPRLLVENQWFGYEGGFGFVSSIHADLGWAGVDALYADPPESTEQILYPERYLDRREHPVSIELAAPPEGWKPLYENNLGLFETRLLLRQNGVWFSEPIAAAWDGDRYAVWRNDDQLALVWYTVWSGPREAQDFAEAFAGTLAEVDPDGTTWAIATEGRVVAVVPAAPQGRSADLLAQLRQSTWKPHPEDAAAPAESFWSRLASFPFRTRRLDRVREVNLLGGALLSYRDHPGGRRASMLGGFGLHALSRPGQSRLDLAAGLLGLRSDAQRGDRELKLLPALRGYLRDDGSFDVHLLEDPLFARSALRVGRSAELDVVELAFLLHWRREPDRVHAYASLGLVDYNRTPEEQTLRAFRVPFTSRWLLCAGAERTLLCR